ncbi:MAG: hypothetical protein ACKVVP_01745, partial [Chloroflexota bacterium]
MDLINDLAYTTGMVLFGAAIALVLAAATSMLLLRQSWPAIRQEVVQHNSTGYGVLTGSVFVAVCALVGVANRQSISPVWDPTFADRVSFLLLWVIFGQIISFIICYLVNLILFGLTPAQVTRELRDDRNASVAAITGMT